MTDPTLNYSKAADLYEKLRPLLGWKESEILDIIAANQPISQKDLIALSDDTHTQSTVSLVVRNLVRAGVVRAVYDTKVYDDGSPDRRYRYYCVNLVQIVKINHVTAQLAAIYDEAE